MKQSYFPYLPNSRNEDNQRYKYIREMMEKNPFTYHKRKNITSSFSTNNYFANNNNNNNRNQDQSQNINQNINQNNIIKNYPKSFSTINYNNDPIGNNANQELLIFQKANDRYMDSYNNFMKQKSSSIEINAQKYLNYITKNKKPYNINNVNVNLLPNNKEKTTSTLPLSNDYRFKKNIIYENKSASNLNTLSKRNNNIINNNTIEVDKRNFIPNYIKARGSDITNPFFYDRIAKEIIKKNQEAMDYNLKESESKYITKKNLPKYSADKVALAPGKINNPKYFSLGESVLDKNPILNKGEYSPSFSRNYKFFSRQENIFDI